MFWVFSVLSLVLSNQLKNKSKIQAPWISIVLKWNFAFTWSFLTQYCAVKNKLMCFHFTSYAFCAFWLQKKMVQWCESSRYKMGEGTRYASEPFAPGKFIEQINYQEIGEGEVRKLSCLFLSYFVNNDFEDKLVGIFKRRSSSLK